MKAAIYGASGGLASSIGHAFLARGWDVELVTRKSREAYVAGQFETALEEGRATLIATDAYPHYVPATSCDAYFFNQALFSPRALAAMTVEEIAAEIQVGLTDIVSTVHNLLRKYPPNASERRDFCFIGSTSAYAGFKNTSVYCAVKHGLLGFVRAMNDEYAQTDTRFWLFSMGTMNTEMGRRLVEQDSTSFLQPDEVAARIVEAITNRTNIFEPEVLLRRRTIRFLEK